MGVFVIFIEPEAQERNSFVDGRAREVRHNFRAVILTFLLEICELCTQSLSCSW